jgi:uncharacterized membrane protein
MKTLAPPPQPEVKVRRTPSIGSLPATSAALFIAANILVVTHVNLPFFDPAVVFWFFFIYPAYLLYSTAIWDRAPALERFAYSVAGALLFLLGGGLAINTVLPWVDVPRPISAIPVLIMVDVINLVLFTVRQRRPAIPSWRDKLAVLSREEIRLLALAGLCIPLTVFGANRLNNGSGDEVTMAAFALMVVAFILLLYWADRITHGITGVVLYLISVALLFTTSLRGWSVTGHDIQLEYRVFQLTVAHGHWDYSSFKNAFNACLSITILPAEIASMTHIDDAYVYKVLFQLIFAACPVMVYTLSNRYFSKKISILSAIYFVGFPTFLTDMPFLNRQEMALIFVAAGLLAVTNPHWKKRRRQVLLVLAGIGVEIAHYSSSYIFIGTLTAVWLIEQAGAIGRIGPWRLQRSPERRERRWKTAPRALGIGCLIAIAAVIGVWGGLVTHTAGGAAGEIKDAVTGFINQAGGNSSADSYGLFSEHSESLQSILDKSRKQTLATVSKAPKGTYLPKSLLEAYPTPVITEPNLPLTGLGRALADVGLQPTAINTDIRLLAADGEQFFVIIGLLALMFSKRWNRKVPREFFYVCVGGLIMLGLITIVPDLSVDYGVLRVFQEELIFLAPIIVIGSMTIFRPLGRFWELGLASALCLFFFISTSGFLPQATGGYGAQLTLNNSGTYYDVYYMHPQEVTAVSWLYGKPGTLPNGIQADNNSDRFSFTAPSQVSGTQQIVGNYPTTIKRSSWVILDWAIVKYDRATDFVNGDLVTYRYPTAVLSKTKNLVFNDGGAQIYR